MAKAIHNRNLWNMAELNPYSGGLMPDNNPDGVMAIEKDGKTFFMNDTAKRLLNSTPVNSIPDPGMSQEPAFYKCKSGTYRVRSLPIGKNGNGRVVLLERYPPEHKLHPKLADSSLSRREREIAEMSFICEQTVKDHLHSIFEKLEIRSRGELTAKVLELRPGDKPFSVS